MGVTRGPKYPGIEDGLVFCFDPKNRDCWSGAPDPKDNNQVFNMVKETSGSVSFANSDEEWAGSITSEGYIHYDGTDDWIKMEDTNTSLGLMGTNIMTATWWGWRSATGATDAYESGFTGVEGTGFGGGWGFYATDADDFYFFIGDGSWPPSTSRTLGRISGTEEWFNMTGVYDGTLGSDNVKIYINGTLTGTPASYTSNMVAGYTSPSYIQMGTGFGTNYPWTGKVGPCMIYNRALSSSEVLTNYNRLKGRFGL